MAEYKVQRVSEKPPREWSFEDRKTGGTVQMETYKVLFEGIEEAVDVNRKPGNKPQVGDMLVGKIETTEFGKRFKAEPKQRPPFTQKDSSEIKAQMAVKAAAHLWHSREWEMPKIEKTASELYSMVGRIKNTDNTTQTGYEKAKAQAQTLKGRSTFSDGTPIPTDEEINGEINLDDIPF